MTADDETRLRKAKALLNEASIKRAELTGRHKELMKRLAAEFRIVSLDEARKRLKTLEGEVATTEEEAEELGKELDIMMEEIGKGKLNGS